MTWIPHFSVFSVSSGGRGFSFTVDYMGLWLYFFRCFYVLLSIHVYWFIGAPLRRSSWGCWKVF